MSSNYKIDLNSITFDAYVEIDKLDKSFVGTASYLGLAYFWHMEYKHYLRDCTIAKRRKIHKKWLDAGLDLVGVSDRHLSIVIDVLDGVTLNSGCKVTKDGLTW